MKLSSQHRGPRAVLNLELPAQVSESEHPGHYDHEAEEDHGVIETRGHDRARYQMQEPEDRDLLIVGRPLSVRETR